MAVVPDTLSLQTSVVSVSDSLLTVTGSTFVTLVTRDTFGNQLVTGGRTVTFALIGGTSAGSFGPISDVGDGTYTAVFTATAAGTPAKVIATIDGAAITSPVPTIQIR